MNRPTLPGRRQILLGSGLALASQVIPGSPQARVAPGSHDKPLWNATYSAKKGAVSLALYRKRASAPKSGGNKAPVVVLAHGSSFSAPTTFDLHVPGAGEYSMMSVLARLGYDVWALDFEGYGRSGSSGGNSDIDASVADLKSAVEVIERETGLTRFNFYGQSSGSLRVGVYAMLEPDRVDRLVLESFTWTGEGSPTLLDRRKNVAAYRASPRRSRDREAIKAIFTRDHPDATDPGIIEAVIASELSLGDTVPSGAYLDMSTKLPLVDPARIQAPVLIARGQWDGIATDDDLLNFYRRLPNPERQFINIAGATHGIILGRHRDVVWRALGAFLPLPT